MALALAPLPSPDTREDPDLGPDDARPARPALRALPGGDERGAVIARLRASLQPARVRAARLSCAWAPLDDWLGGWPLPGVVEVVGEVGTGRLALVLPALAALTQAGRPVVIVDPLQQLHPPGLPGLDLTQLVLVRPSLEQAPWALEQVARSGAVAAVLALDVPLAGRGVARLGHAAEAGRSTLFFVQRRSDADLPAQVRLQTDGWYGTRVRVACTRGRGIGVEGERLLPMANPEWGWEAVAGS